VLLVVGSTMLMPFLWMVSTSLKEPQSVFSLTPAWIPRPVTLDSYAQIWQVVPFARFFLNSVVVAICVTVGHVFTSACAAYAFARLRFPGRDRLFFCYIATMMIPGSVTLIPVFLLMKWLGWVDTYKALIIPGIFSAYGTFLLRQFFLTIPKDFEDAAKIDGGSAWSIFWTIMLPLAKPALATLTLFTFIGNWGSFMWPLLVMDSVEKKTLPIGLTYFQELYQYASPNWPLLMAGSVVAVLPMIGLFLSNQRFFIEGIRLTGVQR
jgi:multiple sugar transport system permease protein